MGAKKKDARTTKRWEPKTWKPIYDKVVGYAVLGKSNLEISEILDKTPVWVSNILTCDQGRKLYNDLAAKVRTQVTDTVEDVMSQIAERSLHNVHSIVHSDELLEKYPFRVAALGLDVLKGVGKLKPDGPTTNNNLFFGVPQELQNQLLEGLDVANQAKQKQLERGRDLNDIKPAGTD